MKPNPIKNDVLAGQPVAGAMIFEFFSPGMSAILANAGCRFVLYDMEHSGAGVETSAPGFFVGSTWRPRTSRSVAWVGSLKIAIAIAIP